MTRDDILSIVREIYFGTTDNAVVSRLLDKLEEALPNAPVSDLIFWDFRDFTPEQLVDEALRLEAEHKIKNVGESQSG